MNAIAMKRSSSVPEIVMGCPALSVATTNLRTRRGISSSQISLPGDLARPAAVSSMEGSSSWRAVSVCARVCAQHNVAGTTEIHARSIPPLFPLHFPLLAGPAPLKETKLIA